MKPEFTSRTPEFGTNYDRGYIGFGYGRRNIVCKGIAYFTRWDRLHDVKVSHALIVTGPDSCIEARFRGGVQESPLQPYFDDPEYQIFFRKPRHLERPVADRIINVATTQLGCKYETMLLATQALSGSFLGRLVHRAFGDRPDLLLSSLVNCDTRWVCSELVAYALDQQHEYQDLGILKDPPETINPQELFEDDEVFTPWHHGPCDDAL